MFSFSRLITVKPILGCVLFLFAYALTAQAACLLQDGPPNTLVPDGYHFPVEGKWKHCKKGSWTIKGQVTKERPYTPNETGVCLPLENQFTKKNGVISMNFVPEKTVRNFYGFEHECVASTWWRIPGGATVSDLSKITSTESKPEKEKKIDPLKGLDDFYKSDPVPPVEQKIKPTASPDVSKPEIPSFSAGTLEEKTQPAKSPPVAEKKPDAPPTTPGFSFQKPASQKKVSTDYKACQVNCRRGMDQRIKSAEQRCKSELRKRYGQGQWTERAEKDFRRCRILAARQENSELRACLLPCKKQAGQHVWQGP